MPAFFANRRRLLAAAVAIGALSPGAMAQTTNNCQQIDSGLGSKKSVTVNSLLLYRNSENPQAGVKRGGTASVIGKGKPVPGHSRQDDVSLHFEMGEDGTWTVAARAGHHKDADGLAMGPTRGRFVIEGTPFAYTSEVDEWGKTTGLNAWTAKRWSLLKKDVQFYLYAPGASVDAKPATVLTFSRKSIADAMRYSDLAHAKVMKRYEAGQCTPISGGTGCFLTTAAVETIGLADDCWELETLRDFRDGWLADQDGGERDIATYYERAPAIAYALRADPARLARIYWTGILPSALAAKLGLNGTARRIYSRQMRALAGVA